MFQKLLSGLVIIFSSSFFFSCVSHDINKEVDCDLSDLEISSSIIYVTACSPANGSITINATGGKTPYTFSINNVDFLTSSVFDNLSAGTYTLTVKDANSCTRTTTVDIASIGSTLAAIVENIQPNTDCSTGNGSFTITASQGGGGYQYKLGSGSFGTSNSFTALETGAYSVTVKDAFNCEFTVNDIVISSNTGVSYQTDIKPILEANCIKSGCHNGDNGAARNWSVFANVKAKATGIKTRTGNKSMPKDIAPTGLPQNQIDLIACWVDDGAIDN
jgi:hypothetical protein